jgi:hypothetical protein
MRIIAMDVTERLVRGQVCFNTSSY